VRAAAFIVGSLFSFAAIAGGGKGGSLERIPSRLLARDVPIALHVPSAASLAAWKGTHPGQRARLVLFLPGAWDGPEELLDQGIAADLARREDSGELAPALWVAVTHYRSWYADRRDGTFPYERFLMEELLPELERRFPGYGGAASARTVAGLSMGGFGALNLAARTGAFSRCAALSPALVRPPFKQAGWFLRRSLRRAFPDDLAAFAPWDPWAHLGGTAELVVACGAEDPHGLAEVTRAFARVCGKRNRQLSASISPGKHDWSYWTPTFEWFSGWINGGPLPQARSIPPRP
jgi:hypothetical protein